MCREEKEEEKNTNTEIEETPSTCFHVSHITFLDILYDLLKISTNFGNIFVHIEILSVLGCVNLRYGVLWHIHKTVLKRKYFENWK